MDYVMRRRSAVGGALEMFSLPLPFAKSIYVVISNQASVDFFLFKANGLCNCSFVKKTRFLLWCFLHDYNIGRMRNGNLNF